MLTIPSTSRLILPLVFVLLGCSPAGSTRSGSDGGTDAGSDTSSARDTNASDGSVWVDSSAPDTAARDTAPRVDAGCELESPVPATIIGDPPDMLLIVDISGSMCTPLGLTPTGESKLAIMKRVLSEQVTDKEARINFGMMLFPDSSGACAAGTVPVGIAPRNAAPIVSRLDGLADDLFGCALANSGATPTPVSVDAARSYYSGIPENPVGRYALLATDGIPNCGPMLEDGSTEETVDESVLAIERLRAAGVTTYVLGFGSGFGSDPAVLNRMASAGGTPRPFSAGSAAELDAALDEIAAEIAPPSCTVELGGPTRNPMLFQVRFDGGELIPRDMSRGRGWDYDEGTNTITFYGPDCAEIQAGDVDEVQVDFGCPGPLI